MVGWGFAGFQSLVFVALLVFAFLAMSVRVVREYERAVVFRLGRLLGVRGPGLFFLIPFVDSMVKVDLRVVAADVPEQGVITRDGVAVGVDAVIYYRVVDPVRAVAWVGDYHKAVLLYGETVLRDVVGQVGLGDLLARREEVNRRLQELLDQVADAWGVKVVAVTLKDVKLPGNTLRAVARQAEGGRQTATTVAEVAMLHEKHPVADRLRELQTLVDRLRELSLAASTPRARVQPHTEGETGGG